MATSAVKRWVSAKGGRLKLQEMAQDFKLGYVADPQHICRTVAQRWLQATRNQRREAATSVVSMHVTDEYTVKRSINLQITD
jgi:hypothetical protein